jgi:hypothetical protein
MTEKIVTPPTDDELGARVRRLSGIVKLAATAPKKTSVILSPQAQRDGRDLQDLQQISFTEAVHML